MEDIHLLLAPENGSAPWSSPLLDGHIEYLDYGSASRADGAQNLRLVLRRADAWEHARLPAPLSNHNGTAVTSGLQLENHTDLVHACWADVETGLMQGDLPAPACVEIINDVEVDGQVDGIWLGCWLGVDEPPAAVLEGESGLSGLTTSIVADSASSNGQFRRVSWSSSGEVTLLAWSISRADLAAFGGQAVRPLARFASSFSYADLWLQLRLTAGGSLLAATPWRMLKPGQKLQELPAIELPPWSLPAGVDPAPLTLQLAASRLSSLLYTLDVDFVHLTPAQGWRKYTPIQALPYGSSLVDDFSQGVFYVHNPDAGALVQHNAAGEDILLWPGRRQRLYLLHGGAACDIAYRTRLKVSYTPRRRVI